MADSKHTPGPWGVGASTSLLVFSTSGMVAHCGCEGMKENLSGEVCVANARLIAAAPALLEALKHAERFIENGIGFGFIHMPQEPRPEAHTLSIVRAAIAKAEGRS